MNLFVFFNPKFKTIYVKAHSEKEARAKARFSLAMGRLPNNTIVRELELKTILTHKLIVK